jgi:hypothetical protein
LLSITIALFSSHTYTIVSKLCHHSGCERRHFGHCIFSW